MTSTRTQVEEATVVEVRKKQQYLLEQVAQGDKEAFSALYEELSSKVHGLVVKVLRDNAQAEEVTQEIFLEVWQLAQRYDPAKGGASTWIMTMAHRRAVDRVRASQASVNRDLKIGAQEYSEGYDDVSEIVETHIESEKVSSAMSRLTVLQKQAVTLAYYGGYTQSEVSKLLKVPLGTVKTRIRDGMIRLRDELGVVS